MNKIIVCPVAYNENIKLRSAIERFLNCPLKEQVDYLIVDDGSDDGTTEMINSFAPQGVASIKHSSRKGVGVAIRTAINYARDKGYEAIVIMAGNDKDNPDEISLLTDPIFLEGCDIVQGSRYLGGKRIGGDMPIYRKIATKIHPFFMSLLTGKRITDSTNGFRAIKLSLFDDKRIDISQEWLNQYELEPYILFKALKLGCKVKEASVSKIYPSKKLGYTKMKPFVGWWSILRPLFFLGLGIKK